ncbi:MAG TPA: hypothetical protein VNU01_11355 [Egibacteraceae bacterium]|nr:hypothetical protein [Egibacteraceae bacterium]
MTRALPTWFATALAGAGVVAGALSLEGLSTAQYLALQLGGLAVAAGMFAWIVRSHARAASATSGQVLTVVLLALAMPVMALRALTVLFLLASGQPLAAGPFSG